LPAKEVMSNKNQNVHSLSYILSRQRKVKGIRSKEETLDWKRCKSTPILSDPIPTLLCDFCDLLHYYSIFLLAKVS